MKMLGLIALILILQGCTVLGAALDSKLDSGDSLTDSGLQADYAILTTLITGEPLQSMEKVTSCDDLKGKKKTECWNKVKQLNESIDKHTKKPR